LPNALVFLLWIDAGVHHGDSELFGYGLRGALVVSGQHHDLQSESAKLSESLYSRIFDRIGNDEHPSHMPVDRYKHHCVSFRLKRTAGRFE
jgi:hypothetical protein